MAKAYPSSPPVSYPLQSLHSTSPGPEDISQEGLLNDKNPPKERSGFAQPFLTFTAIFLPLTGFTIALLYVIYKYRIPQNRASDAPLYLPPDQGEKTNIFVDISAPTLVFIASWSSTVAFMVTGFAMSLLSYPMAQKIRQISFRNNPDDLPTPLQLSLLLNLLASGGPLAFLKGLKYQFSSGRRGVKTSPVLKTTVMTCALAMLFGVFVAIADTTLHLYTKSVEYIQIKPSSEIPLYSRALPESCTAYADNSIVAQSGRICTVWASGTGSFLANSTESIRALNNISSIHGIQSVSPYANDTNFSLLVPTNLTTGAMTNEDYRATSFAVSTTCLPVTKECNMNAAFGASTPFNCTPLGSTFIGDVTGGESAPWYLFSFNDSLRTINRSEAFTGNPHFWALAANFFGFGEQGVLSSDNDSQIVTPIHGGSAYVLFCNSTVYDVDYTYINGSLSEFIPTKANASSADAILAPMTDTELGNFNLQSAAQAALLSSTSQEMANKIADAYSQISLSLASGPMLQTLALQHQSRIMTLVARVPKGPLVALIVSNLLLVMLGLVLGGIAVVALMRERGLETVHSRLSLEGVVAQLFERKKGEVGGSGVGEHTLDLSEEEGRDKGGKRIGIGRGDDGGWRYVVWRKGSSESWSW